MVMTSLRAERAWIDAHENETQSPWKNLSKAAANLQSSQKNLDFSRLLNEIRKRSLVPQGRNEMQERQNQIEL